MEPHFDFTPATERAAPLVALAYGPLVLVGMIELPILAALYSGHFLGTVETLVLAVLVFFAAQQREPVMRRRGSCRIAGPARVGLDSAATG